jgi:hypothetical protein
MSQPHDDSWLDEFPRSKRQQARELVSIFRDLGADNPQDWARSEVSENIPQLARFLFLRRIWPDQIDCWSHDPEQSITKQIRDAERNPTGHFADAGAALKRMTERGITADDIASVARMVAYETAFAITDRVDEGHDPDAPGEVPGWILMETDANGRMTGRNVGGLHEDLLTMDPSGREGQPV